MPSLMVPTAAAAQGVTNRLNTFESDFSDIRQARAQMSQEAATQQQLINNAIGMATAAHNAANDALVLDYSNRLERDQMQLLMDLRTKSNKAAIDSYKPTLDAMHSAVQRYSEELQDADPSVKAAFAQAAQRLSLKSTAAVDAYVIQESKNYRTNELKARVDLAAEDVMRNFDNPVLRSAALERWHAARQLQDADLGIEWGSAQSKSANLESMSAVYSAKADELSEMDNFAGSMAVIEEGLRTGLLKAEAANKAKARTYARQEVAQRQALADARAAQSHAQSMALAQEKLKTEALKQRKYIAEETEKAIKIANSPMSAPDKSAATDVTAKKLIADPEYCKDLPQDLREAQAYTDAALYVEQASASRDKVAVAQNKALQTAQVLSFMGQGHGDSAWESALWAANAIKSGQMAAPKGMSAELVSSQIELLQQSPQFGPESLNAALNLNFGRAAPGATDLATNIVANLPADKIPTDAQGNLDSLKLNALLTREGVTNYDFNRIETQAASKVANKQNPNTAILDETYVTDSLRAIMSEKAEDWLDENFDDIDVLESFDFSLESGGDPLVNAAGSAVMEQVLYDCQEDAKTELKRSPNLTEAQLVSYMRRWMRGDKGKESFTLHLRQALLDYGLTDMDTELSVGAAQLEEARD